MAKSEDYLREAFQAILRGDYAARDALCNKAKMALDKEDLSYREAKVLEVDFYVNEKGVAYSSKDLYAASH
jgi:hypothetical protein